MITRGELFQHIKDAYGVDPDFPWKKDPESAVFRHETSRKWFGLLMKLPESRLGGDGARQVELLNLKCDPLLIGSLRREAGIFPAYHMSKEHWISILLEGPFPREELYRLISQSYDLTNAG